jgi:hypothetical protein
MYNTCTRLVELLSHIFLGVRSLQSGCLKLSQRTCLHLASEIFFAYYSTCHKSGLGCANVGSDAVSSATALQNAASL